MKKFLHEYKVIRSKSESSTRSKWDRVTGMNNRSSSPGSINCDEIKSPNADDLGTIRTEKYKRDLAEFQARRTNKDVLETPVKKPRNGRHSLPISCTDCSTVSPDKTFNYEKKSAAKYKKNKYHKRTKSAHSPESGGHVPNIQFLFQNQVFMPGNVFPMSYTEPQKKRMGRHRYSRSPDTGFLSPREIDFKDDEEKALAIPLNDNNDALAYDAKAFLEISKSDAESACGDKADSCHSDEVDTPTRYDCEEQLQEVMSELKNFDNWADEQLKLQSVSSTRSDGNKSDASVFGLPLVDISNLDMTLERSKEWSTGQWGVVPVNIKKLSAVNLDHVKKKQNTQIEILKKCRHPNIVLLMGLYLDVQHTVHLICESFVDTLYNILHIRGPILTAQKAVDYATDIASALVFLHMHGYIHTDLCSANVVITRHDAAKLSDLGPCVKFLGEKSGDRPRNYEIYTPEPQYVNIEATHRSYNLECEPLISQNPSETYLISNAVAKDYQYYLDSQFYRWQAPELFEPDEHGKVYPCSKSDVYSLSIIVWECCNAAIPWKSLSYTKLKELYVLWKTGIRLPQDGSYPGCLLDLLQTGLKPDRSERIDLKTAEERLHVVKRNLRDLPDLIIPARLSKKKSNFSSVAWDSTSPSDSDLHSPIINKVQAIVHSDNVDQGKNISLYETIENNQDEFADISEDEGIENKPTFKYNNIQEQGYSSACSTPISKLPSKLKNFGTPGAHLHRSDSTEYCSILSPNNNICNIEASDNLISAEHPTTKLSRSFTPKSYKPLHIKVPEFANFGCIKSLCKDQTENDNLRSAYNFDIKNYSLPNTPIARSNKLRKNAWLSGDFDKRSKEKLDSTGKVADSNCFIDRSQTPEIALNCDDGVLMNEVSPNKYSTESNSPGSGGPAQDCFVALKKMDLHECDCSPETDYNSQFGERTHTWSYKSTPERAQPVKCKIEEDVLANINVKPLVAIHERWIYEANRKTARSMSLPEENRSQIPAMKPASHCVGTLQHSLPQLSSRRSSVHKYLRSSSLLSSSSRSGPVSEQFSKVREFIAKSVAFAAKDPPSSETSRNVYTQCITSDTSSTDSKIDQATDTVGIEEFIKDLIRKEFQNLVQDASDELSTNTQSNKNEELVDKGMANVMEALTTGRELPVEEQTEKIRSFSRIKINGNNKPLLQITFTRSGENNLQVLDNCVNVTLCDNNSKEKLNQALEESYSDDLHCHSLKRCQAFNALQEARSTEDLYIDDDLSTHMQENFGGRVKLIPLHGSLHEILCEKEDDCCLIKVKQENGCDTIYFKCDNSDTESKDAIDGNPDNAQDTVVYKRSISLIEERIQRIVPKDRRNCSPVLARKIQSDTCTQTPPKVRPKSATFSQNFNNETRMLSNSSPSLFSNTDRAEEVEVNLEHAVSYQDSSSDECLKYQQDSDEFERLEKKIEEDVAKSNSLTYNCGCLEKISEENLSLLTDDNEKEHYSF